MKLITAYHRAFAPRQALAGLALLVAAWLSAPPASADSGIIRYGDNSFSNVTHTPGLTVYKHIQPDGVPAFSDRAPTHRNFDVVRIDCHACRVNSTVDWQSTPLYLTEYDAPILDAATLHGVDPALVRAVIHAESAFNPLARSSKGALGLMQLMPETARDMGVSDPAISEENIHGGVRYLAVLLDKFAGDITLATAAYNAGPGAVDRHNGVPPYAETKAYVQRVRILHDRYRPRG